MGGRVQNRRGLSTALEKARLVLKMGGCQVLSCIVLCASSQAHPVHLWDACHGGLRCTYRGYNDVDEVTAAFRWEARGDRRKARVEYAGPRAIEASQVLLGTAGYGGQCRRVFSSIR